MSTAYATPRPWRIGVSADNGIHCVDATMADGTTVEICEVWGVAKDKTADPESRANAILIVRACNAYDELLDALRSIADTDYNSVKTARSIARTALAKAGAL